jgi:amidohydrolase
MPLLPAIEEDLPRLRALRQTLHAHPELSLEEGWTSAFIAEELSRLGLEVHTGIGGHGVVAVIRGAGEGAAVALRADMDALAIEERNALPYASQMAGKMHACGHDGHMAMLLGAAVHLARTRRFRGTVYLVFQPAEERYGGAQKMIDDGLLQRFPMQQIFGLHNWPGLKAGAFVIHDGPVMAGTGEFEIEFSAAGAHAAMPHITGDPILAGGLFVTGAQQIVARAVDPQNAAVVTIGSFRGGQAQNIIPKSTVLSGTFRAFLPQVLASIEERLEIMVHSAAAMASVEGQIRFDEIATPPVVNAYGARNLARDAATDLFGADAIESLAPSMAGDDFGVFLQHLPGAYAWIGNGADSAGLHLPNYDFNDDIIVRGASFLAATAERALS